MIIMEVTTLALEKFKESLQETGEEGAFRVIAVLDTNNVQYKLGLENETQDDDTVLELDGLQFLMDSDSLPFLETATIDYVENLGGQVGFVINNPMYAAGGCGCGNGGCGGGGCGNGGCGCGGGGCGCGSGGCK